MSTISVASETRKVSLTLDGNESQFEIPSDATDEVILGAARETSGASLNGFVVDRASQTLIIVRPKVPFGSLGA